MRTVLKRTKTQTIILIIISFLFIGFPIETLADFPSTRIYGENRYETAVKVAQSTYSASDYAILTSGENFPDALAASVLAQKYNAPILLTQKSVLTPVTLSGIINLGIREVFICGGVEAVEPSVERMLQKLNVKVIRLAGDDRYDTAVRIADQLGPVKKAFFVSGSDYLEALTLAPIAANLNIPIILLPGDYLPASVKGFLARNDLELSYIIGDELEISEEVASQLPNPERIKGSNKYDHCLSIIDSFKSHLDMTNVVLATGSNFADSLAGGVYAAKLKARIIVLNPEVDSALAEYIKSIKDSVKTWRILGGEQVIPDQLFNSYLQIDNTIEKIDDLDQVIGLGQEFTFPQTITALMHNGRRIEVNVVWDKTELNSRQPGTYVFNGSVDGYDRKIKMSVRVESSGQPVRNVKEFQDYLNANYSCIYSPLGKITLSYTLVHDETGIMPYEYWIKTSWNGSRYFPNTLKTNFTGYEANDRNEIKDNVTQIHINEQQKEQTRQALIELQQNIAREAIANFPNRKITGGYYQVFQLDPQDGIRDEEISTYKGRNTITFLTWNNYSGDKNSGFQWYPYFDTCDLTK